MPKTIPLSYLPSLIVPVGEMLSGDGAHLMGIAQAANQFLPSGNIGAFTKEAANSITYELTGYTPYQGTWNWEILARNFGLVIVGLLAHKLARPVNAKMKNIPFIGRYISI